jgi:hypothetical protein
MSNLEIVKTVDEWLAEDETRRKMRICADRAIEIIENDASLRVPRMENERRQAFAAWIIAYKQKLGPAMQEQFRQQFPGISEKLNKSNIIDTLVDDNVWPLVEPTLKEYAVRGLASDWVRQHLGDAVLTGSPEFHNDRWDVPLTLSGMGENLGRVSLDRDGNILPDLTSSRDALLKAAHDRKLHPVAAVAGQ